MLIFVTVYHDACIENLLLRLILFTFRIKLKPPLCQMSDFTLSPPPFLAAILCNAPPLVFQPPPLLIIIAQSLISISAVIFPFVEAKDNVRRKAQ